jgi:hypothetical protein
MAAKNFSPENVPPEQANSVWLDDGVLYINFNQPFTFEAVQETNSKGNVLREAAGLTHVPVILIYTNAGKKIDLNLPDLTNASVSANLEAVSTIITVGLDGPSLQLAKLANKFVFKNRLVFCNTLEQAREIAQPFKGTTTAILDEDKFSS